jgi:uncharacterized cupin superfamily protein
MLRRMPTDLPFHVDDVAPERREFGEIAGTRRRLGAAAGARRLGIALIEIDPGKRFSPPHSHADEDEVFLVLAGSGLSYLTSSPDDARTYAVGVDDVLWHPSNGEAHTLIAGEDGLTVLVVAEGSRTNITFLPRTGQFWLGPHWTPADTEHPFVADAALGPLEPPAPTAERPPNIRNLSELPLHAGQDGRLAYATRDARDVGSDKLVLAQDEMPPDTHNTDLHFHSAREEAWYVRSGSGIARLGEDAHPLRAGSFWFARENAGVGHRIEVGPEGMQLVTMGDLIPGDVSVCPEKRTFRPARGLELRY